MSTISSKTFDKEGFITFLNKININENTINKFKELPEKVERSGSTFELYINSIWYDKEDTYYTFEINYYSHELIEYLFGSKVFTDINICINNLLCELMNANIIKKNDIKCK